MGLLDFMSADDPQSQGLLGAAMGLLNASGPSRVPIGMGQAMAQGLQGLHQGQQSAQKQQMLAEQLKMLKLQEQRAQNMFDMQKSAFQDVGGGNSMLAPAMPGQLGSGAFGTSLPPSGMPEIQPQQSGGSDTSAELRKLQKYAILGVPGSKELFDIYKYKTDGVKRDPGSIVDYPGGRREYIPDVKSGIGSYDLNTNTMTPVSGFADFQAQLEGGKAAATESAKAKYNTTTLNLPGGPRMVSNAQLPSLMNGDASRGTGDGLDLSKLSPQQIQFLQKQDPEAFVNGLSRFSSSQSGPGLQLQSDAEKEAQVGAVRVKNSVDEALLKAYPEAAQKKQIALVRAQDAMGVIDKALAHPGLSAATGLQGTIDPRNYIPGTDARNFQSVLDQIKGGTFLQAFDQLRGAGQITEIEGRKATDALARLNAAQSTDEFKTALQDYRSVLDVGMQRLKGTPDQVDIARGKIAGTPPDMPTNSAAKPVASSNIPQPAINHLKFNPKLRAQFDAKYGQGAADSVLGK